MAAKSLDTLARVQVTTAQAWRDWLAAHHGQTGSVWLVTFKKHCGDRHVPYDDAVDEAIAHGWIDGVPRKLDADRSMTLMAPRRSGSAWSRINKARVERLTQQGRMHAVGLAVVAQAQQDGSWTFLDDVEDLIQPDDLKAALARHPGAADAFGGFPRWSQRAILEWIKTAKRPDTRARRVAETAIKAAQGLRANQGRR